MKRIGIYLFALMILGCRENFDDLLIFKSISGEVLDQDSLEPIEGAKISTNPISELTLTDADGVFTIDSLSADIYIVRVVADGYANELSSFDFNDIGTSGLTILLEKDSTIIDLPSTPSNPSPINGAEEQGLNVDLTWSNMGSNDTLTYNVYFYKEGNLEPTLLGIGITDTFVNTGLLDFNTSYFWQVEVEKAGVPSVLSPVWNFRTQAFPDETFRYAFNQKVGNFEHIFIGNDDGARVQVTSGNRDFWKPLYSPQQNKIAFLGTENGDVHIFRMDKNGSEVERITNTVPLRTKDFLESSYAWANNGSRLIYMDFSNIVSIAVDGSGGFNLPIDVAEGEIVTSLDYSALEGGRIAFTTEEINSKSSKIFLYEMETDSLTQLLDSLEGQFGHVQFSPSGLEIVMTFNKREEFSTTGIPLNQRIYRLDLLDDDSLTDLSVEKPGGTADRHPRIARNGGFLVFANTQSDGVGSSNVLIGEISGLTNPEARDTLFENARFIDWE